MAGTPAEPPPSPSGGDAGRDERPAPPERYGVVRVERNRKDDGRALILYTRVAQDAP